VEVKRDDRGMIHLRARPTPTGLMKKVARLFHYDFSKQVELDEYGTLYFSQIDGRKTLRDIVEALTGKLGDDRQKIAEGVILFTRNLMARNLIMLEVPRRRAGAEENASPPAGEAPQERTDP
jgi:hypothetical protein